jgi:nicotinamidase-related amidase
VHADLRSAYNRWEERAHASVNKVLKGSNPWTEHYSAIAAEVPDDSDAASQTNRALIDQLSACDRVYICGEAGSHCVRATTEHLVAHWDPQHYARLMLLTDCISPVHGFEDQYRDFLANMAAHGVQLGQSSDALAELQGNT